MRSVPILIMLFVNEFYNNKTTYIIEYSMNICLVFLQVRFQTKTSATRQDSPLKDITVCAYLSKIHHIILLSAPGA